MRKNFFLSPAAGESAGESAGKADQTDVLAKLSGMETLLAPLKLTLPDLISQHASLTTDKTALTAEVAKLKGDSTKLAAGVSLPTDLVSAANTIADLTAKVSKLESEKLSVEEAAAKKIVALGFTDNKQAKADDKNQKPKTLTEKVLEAKGVKTLAEAQEKFAAEASKNN